MSSSSSQRSDLDPEQTLIRSICAAGLVRAGKQSIETDGVDWTKFMLLARRHRIVPVIWRSIAAVRDRNLPPKVLRELKEADQQNALSALQSAAHLVKIVTALSAAGISSLPLKGVALAALQYGDIAGRFVGDIDLLVSPEHLARANAIMGELGYARISNDTRAIIRQPFQESTDFRLHSMHLSVDGAIIELHFQLHFNPAILSVDVAEIVASGPRTTFGKASLPSMPADLQFVFLATHGARHEWERLQWIYDIALMVDRASDAEVRSWLATAERHRLTNPVIQGMVLAQRMFGIALPEEVELAYRRSLRIRYMVQRASRSVSRGPATPSDVAHDRPKLGRRLYRMCVTGRPDYLWHELRNGMGALAGRMTKSAVRA